MARMRKLRDDDRLILSKVIRDVGRKTTVHLLCLWIGVPVTPKQRYRVYSFGPAPHRFMRDILRDYTVAAVLNAIRDTPAAKGEKFPTADPATI
jgi:hypothetical protein